MIFIRHVSDCDLLIRGHLNIYQLGPLKEMYALHIYNYEEI
jgi:hypothetical protein